MGFVCQAKHCNMSSWMIANDKNKDKDEDSFLDLSVGTEALLMTEIRQKQRQA